MDRTLNQLLAGVFTAQMLLCLVDAIGSGVWFNAYGIDSWYLCLDNEFGCMGSESLSTNWYGTNEPVVVGLLSFFTFFILLSNFVPISLYVTVEFIKLFTGQSLPLCSHQHLVLHSPVVCTGCIR